MNELLFVLIVTRQVFIISLQISFVLFCSLKVSRLWAKVKPRKHFIFLAVSPKIRTVLIKYSYLFMKLKKCMPRFLSFYEGDTLYFILGNSSLRKQLNGNTLVYACKYLLGLSHINQYDKHVNMSS